MSIINLDNYDCSIHIDSFFFLDCFGTFRVVFYFDNSDQKCVRFVYQSLLVNNRWSSWSIRIFVIGLFDFSNKDEKQYVRGEKIRIKHSKIIWSKIK
jgi:hypothetical protein